MPLSERADLLLLMDVGGHAAKVEIRETGGKSCAAARRDLPRGERHATDILQALETAIAEAAAQLGPEAGQLRAAGLAVSRADVLCWSRMTGEPFTPVLGWQDRRAADWLADQGLDAAHVRQVTGLPLSAHYGAAKLHWCLASVPEVGEALLEGNLAWGPLGSYLVHRLTEERSYVVDPTLAQRLQLWDAESGAWSEALAAAFDIPEFTLPRLATDGENLGHLRVLGQAVPLRLLVGDQNAVPYAAGPPQDNAAALNLGSGAFLLVPRDNDACSGGWLHSRLPVAGSGRPGWACEATVNGAAAALEWWADECGIDFTPDRLHEWLAADPGPLVFLNGINGLGSPWWQPDFPSRFSAAAEPAAGGRAVAESIAFLLAGNLECLSGPRPAAMRVSGGLAASADFLQLLADVTGLELHPAASGEATLDGLSVLLGGSAAADGGKPVLPRSNPAVQRRHERWRALMPSPA